MQRLCGTLGQSQPLSVMTGYLSNRQNASEPRLDARFRPLGQTAPPSGNHGLGKK
ncbi:hypothetical protein K239x_04540 [Planctomycetes bacterium K23_9]|uniref:Uncharacterized protein n=1 Tax=Stieleria marina TaxID=1930275 RepID=A0A517NN03_9BACT|nr:hypothetical protein K239x_04540 [Planctomycetes bacterium K23_9]